MAGSAEVTTHRRRARLLLGAGALVALGACTGGGGAALPLGYAAPTTDGVAALANLDAAIAAQETALARRPDLFAFRRELVSSLLARAGFAGTFDDLDRAEALTAEALADAGEPDAHLLRAQVLAKVHRFDEARVHLDAAPGNEGEGTSLLIAQGRDLGHALAVRRAAAIARPSFSTLADLATAEAAAGNFVAADELYRAALAEYRDVSPLPVAWVFFQRGVMWSEAAGRAALGRPLYEEAVRRLPGYVSANVHLAELEWSSGQTAAAVARLEGIVDRTGDPEPASRLARWSPEPSRARAHGARAREAYERLLARHPLAFLDHASEFFAAGEDPTRGLSLAEENLRHRQNGRAYLLVLQAAEAASRLDRVCAVAVMVPPAALAASVPLRERVAAARRRCAGDPAAPAVRR